MLESVELLDRRSVRRQVHLDCEVVSTFWEDPVAHRASDLSEHGVFIETLFPLALGEVVFVCLRPPRWQGGEELLVTAAVRRVELLRRTTDMRRSGMGLEFLDLTSREKTRLASALSGLPPPLPRGKRAFARALVWVDQLLTWEEDLGDRVNVYEVSEALGPIEDDDFDIASLADPVPLAC